MSPYTNLYHITRVTFFFFLKRFAMQVPLSELLAVITVEMTTYSNKFINIILWFEFINITWPIIIKHLTALWLPVSQFSCRQQYENLAQHQIQHKRAHWGSVYTCVDVNRPHVGEGSFVFFCLLSLKWSAMALWAHPRGLYNVKMTLVILENIRFLVIRKHLIYSTVWSLWFFCCIRIQSFIAICPKLQCTKCNEIFGWMLLHRLDNYH